MRKLKEISPNLHIFFNPRVKRWEVWEQGKSKSWYLFTRIENSDGSFRPVDERVIVEVLLNDLERKPFADWMGLARLHDQYAVALEDEGLKKAEAELVDRWYDFGYDHILRDAYTKQVPRSYEGVQHG